MNKIVETGDGTVGKALEVLDSVAAVGGPVRFTDLLANSPFPKATLYRFLQTLTHQGMLSYDPDRQTYALGMRLVRLAHTAWSRSSLAPIARPHLDRLSAELGETLHLAQLDQGQVLYVDKRNAAQPVEMFSSAGKVGPAYCTGVGKAMMAHLPPDAVEQVMVRQSFHRFTPHTYTTPAELAAELTAITKRGYAFDREEHEPGIICIAVPILSDRGRAIGAISVTSTTTRTDLGALKLLAPRLRAVAQDIAGDARDWRFPEQ
ncbi:transcriptional regulator, IclR family [Pseudorhodobacter antarcticus]|uniref:Transcriptional regulator, IclR family n=1 Tax=Pseudorhodobacter antarcticus TaxID=1077947 RepID=A0A1H8AN20_9RHOB|nr:transcriptional regulator, IclR family [Pseudorhodobacter antarcticus]